jgi:hypothetical protein
VSPDVVITSAPWAAPILRRLFDHLPKGSGVEITQVLVGALDLEPEACGEVFLVADHHVDVSGEPAVHLMRALDSADPLPQAGPVVEVVGHDGAVARGGVDGFGNHLGRRLR